MARKLRQGIEYFPLDVDILNDIKTRRILRECGTESIAILLCLLCRIYKYEGYFMEWSSSLDRKSVV